ncbi:hypothetical protein [Micromonospora profundi]|uniref:hypothetical protein n=1 Tax=Micromonospora profundi TaxID=1420889 RepID=UPI003662512E
MELLLGAMIVALWVKTIPGVIADAVTTLRASKAGEWSLIDKQRDRKAAKSKSRREAMSRAWQGVRSARNRKAGGSGQYRPGMAAYLGDVYHGVWEDQLEKRQVKRANRPPVGPDGRRPAPSKLDRAVASKVDAQRAKTGYMGRIKQVGRLLWEPVGEGRRDGDVLPPDTKVEPVPANVAETAADLYRINRAEGRNGALGETQTARDLQGMFGNEYPPGVYEQAAADATKTEPLNGEWMPNHADVMQAAHDALADADPDKLRQSKNMNDAYEAVRRAFPRIHPEAIAEFMAIADQAPGCDSCGQRHGVKPPCVHQQAAAKEPTTPTRPGPVPHRKPRGVYDQDDTFTCGGCGEERNAAIGRETPDGLRCAFCQRYGSEAIRSMHHHDGTLPQPSNPDRQQTSTTINNGGVTMSTATGDVVNVETCKSECEALDDDLTRIDSSLDVIDAAIRSAQQAAENIEAWLKSKNIEGGVAGMSAAFDALSADRIKDLIDTVAAAKQGVRDTIDSLTPLEEANELVGAADGSALNGR